MKPGAQEAGWQRPGLANQLADTEARLRAAEAHATELGLVLGELGEALGLSPGPDATALNGLSPAERRVAYAERLLVQVRAAKRKCGVPGNAKTEELVPPIG